MGYSQQNHIFGYRVLEPSDMLSLAFANTTQPSLGSLRYRADTSALKFGSGILNLQRLPSLTSY